MTGATDNPSGTTLRDPVQVMRLARLGSIHQCRLSFMRILTRRMRRENWTFSRPVFAVDDLGVGHAVYTAQGPGRAYSLVAFAHDLPDDQRSDRVIATAWDATFTLFDGVPTEADIRRLSRNVPLQEAGRITESEISLSRANRSVRLWNHVVESLADGRQPDARLVGDVGYLMRTTAVYGSGKFGAADRETIAGRPEFAAPFQAEMLSVFLTRAFVRDLVQHMALTKGGARAVTLDPDIARMMGIGNSTGLGMAPFLLYHPRLLNNWITAKETAIARVRQVETATKGEVGLFRDMLGRSVISADMWQSEHPVQVQKLSRLRGDLVRVVGRVEKSDLHGDYPWNRLYCWAEEVLSLEGQECIAALMLEPYGALVDDLADNMADNSESDAIDGTLAIKVMRDALERQYGWALAIDWARPETHGLAWYVSAEKQEPRLGNRFEEPIAPYELPLAPGRDAAALAQELRNWPDDACLADFLLRHPEHRHIVRRVLLLARAPYGEIRDNTISTQVFPVDMLRFKLGMFGATHFDPRSDRWVRITMYGGAPYPDEIATLDADFWPYPRVRAT